MTPFGDGELISFRTETERLSLSGSVFFGLEEDLFDFEKPKPRPISVPYSSTPAAPARNFGAGPSGSLDYSVGDTVRHIKFGVGTVTNIVSGGRDYEVTVLFETYGVKKLLATFANLKKC